MTEQTLIERLRIRANIRRNATNRKSVQNGEPDRIADLLEESADEIAKLQAELAEAKRLLSDARRDVSYASDISELSAITLANIDEFLNQKK